MLYILAAPVRAQMVQPFIEGDTISIEQSSVRCMPHQALHSIAKTKGMHIILTSTSLENVTKVIFASPRGDVMVTNIFPNDKACVLDIQENAAWSNDIHFPKEDSKPQ